MQPLLRLRGREQLFECVGRCCCAAGARLHHKRLTAKRLRKAVHSTISMRPGAERIARAFAGAGGATAAADALEELLSASKPEERLHSR